MDESSAGGPAASTGSRAPRRLVVVVGAAVLAAVVLGLQATLVQGLFSSGGDVGGVRLPSSLDPLLSGPAPVTADLPFVLPPGLTTGEGAVDAAGGTPTGSGSGADSTVGIGDWAQELSPRVGIPPVALAAYGAAQLVVAATDPGCRLSWPTLAGIGYIESQHGGYGGAALGADGRSTPPIVGIALDGRTGVALVSDTDDGVLDGDPTLDRAVGPMQFIPSTWAVWGVDGDLDGLLDPFDIDDAALAAGRYLCASGGDLATGSGWTRSVYAYNASDRYVLDVRAAADEYAARSTAS